MPRKRIIIVNKIQKNFLKTNFTFSTNQKNIRFVFSASSETPSILEKLLEAWSEEKEKTSLCFLSDDVLYTLILSYIFVENRFKSVVLRKQQNKNILLSFDSYIKITQLLYFRLHEAKLTAFTSENICDSASRVTCRYKMIFQLRTHAKTNLIFVNECK